MITPEDASLHYPLSQLIGQMFTIISFEIVDRMPNQATNVPGEPIEGLKPMAIIRSLELHKPAATFSYVVIDQLKKMRFPQKVVVDERTSSSGRKYLSLWVVKL